jgi:hypothetical protein
MALTGEQIPPYIQTQIKHRQKAHGSGVFQESLRTDADLLYTNSRNAFIKMASGVSITEGKLKELGFSGADLTNLKGMGLAQNYVLFGGISTMNEKGDRLIQKTGFYGQEGVYSSLNPEFGMVPMPGIQSLSVKSLNRGSLKKATIKLVAQNRDQLSILDVLYMRLGYTVLIEWGNSIYLDKDGNLQQMNTSLIENPNVWFNKSWSNKQTYLDVLPLITKKRDEYCGNFDALLGKISNFNWSFNPDGSYDIELTIISLGDVVESIRSNVPAAYNTLKYVKDSDIGWTSENDTLDQHRKDNIILSLLHVFRLLNQNPSGNDVTIETEGQDVAYVGNLLGIGGNTITYGEHNVVYTYTVGWKDKNGFINPDKLVEGYYNYNGREMTQKEVDEQVFIENNRGKQITSDYYKGYGYDIQAISAMPPYKRARIVFKNKETTKIFSVTQTFNQQVWDDYIVNDQKKKDKDLDKSTNPISQLRYGFFQKYKNLQTSTGRFVWNKPTEKFNAYDLISKPFRDFYANRTELEQLGFIQKDNRPGVNAISISFDQDGDRKANSVNTQNISNPLKDTDYNPNDGFVLKLDQPQYYIRFGYLLDLLKTKVITRIKAGKGNYNDNPNLFDIDTSIDNNLMLCLPQQISFDWRICTVRRDDFNRDKGSKYKQKVLSQLEEWHNPGSNYATSMNVYLNFLFIADSMISNSDEKGNVSVYDFIKSMCDGISKAMGGINNLEPIIDEDSNTLRIFESTPIPKNPFTPGYTLQLYGYGNGVTNSKDSSTFVRKIDLKTAITPEYATMITVGATAGGYVKGTEATAFAKWNDGLIDRFKAELIAADSETQQDSNNDIDDTIASFESAMNWTSFCFGIKGAGPIWKSFPTPTGVPAATPAPTTIQGAASRITSAVTRKFQPGRGMLLNP